MQITSLGHSCLLVQTPGARVLIDPGTLSDFAGQRDLSAILVTHQHVDHCDPDQIADLVAANPGAIVRADPQTTAQLVEKGLSVTANEAGSAYTVGDVTVTPVGRLHAEITPYVDRIDNLGLVLEAGGTTLFHPGDALDADPGRPIDVLAVPVNAPWCAVKETIEFVRRVEPGCVVPIHDALLAPGGRGLYVSHIKDFGRDGGVEVRDLAGAGAQEF